MELVELVDLGMLCWVSGPSIYLWRGPQRTPRGRPVKNGSPDSDTGIPVATCMGGLGRELDGSYAEFTCVAQENIRAIPDTRSLTWPELAALPEMLQTAWGSLTAGLDLQPGESLLIRGATSSIGLCALQLAQKFGAGHIAGTTRNLNRVALLESAGATEVLVDDGDVAGKIETSGRGGFDKVLELVGTTT